MNTTTPPHLPAVPPAVLPAAEGTPDMEPLRTQQLHALGNRASLYQVFKLLESLPVMPTRRYDQLAYLEQLYMRSQPEHLPHPRFVLRRYELVLHLAQRHPDYPLFCRWRELIRWLNDPLRLRVGCWREFLANSRPEVPQDVLQCIFNYLCN
ncbi:MAG: hypothetical protein C0424_09435 [Sphingobacteriaceae bacterium]|nr:hypothetical protein [Sphingobacteriaceae bacterium]